MARLQVARMAGSAPHTLQQMGPLLAKLGFLDTSPLGWFLASTSSLWGPCHAALAAGELDDGAAARCDGCLGALLRAGRPVGLGGEPVSKTRRGRSQGIRFFD